MKLLHMPKPISPLPAERFPSSPISAGPERGDSRGSSEAVAALRVLTLEDFVEFMQFCGKCDSEQIFRAGWECELGLLGCCLGCGDERLAPWTRTTEVCA